MGCRSKKTCKKVYRSDNKMIFGVCQGISDHFDLSVVWIRLGCIATFVLTGFFPLAIFYFVAALIMKPKPKSVGPEPYYEEEFYETEVSSRSLSLRRLKSKFEAIEHRIRRMEDYVTNKSYDWERRFRTGE